MIVKINLTKFESRATILLEEKDMNIEFVGKRVSKKLKYKIEKAVTLVLDELKQEHNNLSLSVMFVNEKDMRELNNRTRNIDKVTDVLSYPNFNLKPYETITAETEDILGDMAICLKQAKRQAKEYKVTLDEEVVKLVIHSTLHLMGFDHIEDADYEVMQKEEERLASKFYTNIKI